MTKKFEKKEFVIIQTIVEMDKDGRIEETVHITQKSDNLTPKFKKILELDYAIEEKELC